MYRCNVYLMFGVTVAPLVELLGLAECLLWKVVRSLLV